MPVAAFGRDVVRWSAGGCGSCGAGEKEGWGAGGMGGRRDGGQEEPGQCQPGICPVVKDSARSLADGWWLYNIPSSCCCIKMMPWKWQPIIYLVIIYLAQIHLFVDPSHFIWLFCLQFETGGITRVKRIINAYLFSYFFISPKSSTIFFVKRAS